MAPGGGEDREPMNSTGVLHQPVIYVVIAGFFAVLIAIGVIFRRFNRNTSDYFRAGGMAKWWLVGASIFMGNFSAWTFTGAAGAAYQSGFSLMVLFWVMMLSFIGPALATAGWMRQCRTITGTDVVRLRFGPATEQAYGWLQVVTGPVFAAVQLYTLAVFCSSVLGVDVRVTIMVLGVAVLFYSVLGGAWAVLGADFVQCLVVLPITIALAFLCLLKLGGVSGLFERIAQAGLAEQFSPFKSTASEIGQTGRFTFAWFIAWIINGQMTQNSVSQAQRYLAAKDGREARKAAGLVSALFILAGFVWVIPPITSRLLFADQVAVMPLNNPADGAYAVASLNLLPVGLVGLVLVAVFAATMSSLDAGLTSLAGNITQNIYPDLCRRFGWRERVDGARLTLGRVINLGCCLTAVVLAIGMARSATSGAFDLLIDVIVILGAPLVIPNFWGLFIRRTPRGVWMMSVAAGFVGSVLVFLKTRVLGGPELPLHWQVVLVHGLGSLGFLVPCLFYRRNDAENESRIAEFFHRRDTPIDFGAEIGAGNDTRQLKVAGAFGAVIALMIATLALLPSSRGHVPVVLTVASITGALGVALLLLSRQRARSGQVAGAGVSQGPSKNDPVESVRR